MQPDKAETLRQKLKFLREEREKAMLEKGLAAEDNKDLRENFAYDYWEQQETNISAQIFQITKEIEELTGIKKHKRVPSKKINREELAQELKKSKKWL